MFGSRMASSSFSKSGSVIAAASRVSRSISSVTFRTRPGCETRLATGRQSPQVLFAPLPRQATVAPHKTGAIFRRPDFTSAFTGVGLGRELSAPTNTLSTLKSHPERRAIRLQPNCPQRNRRRQVVARYELEYPSELTITRTISRPKTRTAIMSRRFGRS